MSQGLDIRSDYKTKYGFTTDTKSFFETEKGLTERTIREMSEMKKEPEWMLKFRLKALEHFKQRPMPMWGPDLSRINFDDIVYYVKPTEKSAAKSWEDLPLEIKKTFDALGIPEAERKFLAGVGSQFESENVYHSLQKHLEKKGVIFVGPEEGLRDYPHIFKKYFGTVVPIQDNKFAALNSAVFSGGSFIYIPPGVHVEMPLQAYFRINRENVGQFERTLIIADKGSKVHYLEACSAPLYSDDKASLHTAVVELVALPGAQLRYTTLQNWSNNVYNLVTKRSVAHEGATVEWLDANIGARVTQKYPSVYMVGPNAKADILSIAFAGKGQHQDSGGKAIHMAPNTTSRIISKSVSRDGGRSTYRGLLQIMKGAINSKSTVRCDALLLDEISRTDTYPYNEIQEDTATVTHEAAVGKIGEDLVFYLMSRGLSEQEALGLVVNGFFEIFTKELPMEYAIEFNRLIQLEMSGAVG